MFNDNRPKLKLAKDKTQRILEFSTFGIIALATIYTIINYGNLPEQIPKHFNISGEVDSYGNRDTIWLLIILALGLCYGLLQLNKYPHLFNYPDKITEDNARKYYTSAIKLMSLLNLLIAVIFAIIIYQTISLGLSGETKTLTWTEYLLYIIIGIMTFTPLIWIAKIILTPNKK